MNKQFKDLLVGEKFIYNDEIYTKTEPESISCCKTLNAIKDSNNEKVMITPLQEVTTN